MSTTFEPVRQAALQVPRQALRCIGTFETLAGSVDYPVGWDEASRDTRWAQTFLEQLGVQAGDFVAVVSTGHEAPWYAPILDAVTCLRATICPLEPARFEVGRALMFFRRFPVSVVIGLDEELAAAIDASGGLQSVLGRVRSVVSRPEGRQRLMTLPSFRGMLSPLGPAMGLPCLQRVGMHVNEAEWAVEANLQTQVVARGHRASGLRPWSIPVPLSVEPGQCTCLHGRQSWLRTGQ